MDAGASPDAGTSLDAGTTLDATIPEDLCFADVPLITLTGPRTNFDPRALLAHPDGWIAMWHAVAVADGVEGTFASYLDREGRLLRTEPIDWEDMWQYHFVIGRYLVSWGTWHHHRILVHEIGADGLIAIDSPVPFGHVGQITELQYGSDGIVRVISGEPTEDWSVPEFRYRYAELVLGDDGRFTARSGLLPRTETLGSDALVRAVGLYHMLPWPTMSEGSLDFVFPSWEDPGSIEGQPWIVIRTELDTSGLATGEPLAWRVVDERRWERGPISVFGVLPELEVAIAGRWDSLGRPGITAERWTETDGGSTVRLDADDDSEESQLGPAWVVRRGDRLGLQSLGSFRVFTLPTFTEEAAVALDLSWPLATWNERDQVAELGPTQRPGELGPEIDGWIRCHELR